MSAKAASHDHVWYALGQLAGVLAREDGVAYIVDTLRQNEMLAAATEHLRDRLSDVLMLSEAEVPGHTEE